MWMFCGFMSVVLCIVGWTMMIKEDRNVLYASIGSLAFTMLTLLMEYKEVVSWVHHSDWTALQDTVPSTFIILMIYTVIIFIANIVPMVLGKQAKNEFLS